MGKLGGRELNYASDVDVVFLHREVAPTRRSGPGARPRP
jgi:glutamine synthetase adenylyltransferase